jgi:hypothetical protein
MMCKVLSTSSRRISADAGTSGNPLDTIAIGTIRYQLVAGAIRDAHPQENARPELCG